MFVLADLCPEIACGVAFQPERQPPCILHLTFVRKGCKPDIAIPSRPVFFLIDMIVGGKETYFTVLAEFHGHHRLLIVVPYLDVGNQSFQQCPLIGKRIRGHQFIGTVIIGKDSHVVHRTFRYRIQKFRCRA